MSCNCSAKLEGMPCNHCNDFAGLKPQNKDKMRNELRAVPAHPGIANLVNTCYMAASLQLLYHLKPLRNIFQSGLHVKEINENNRMGSKGRIARCYAEFVHRMLTATTNDVSPQNFLKQFSVVNSLFESIYQQHDAHEFLASLLDGLHEDMNRIETKPYVEMNAQKEGEDLHDCAHRFDKLFRLRDDSTILDLFAGLYISRVECLSCNYSTASFERFNVLQLPVPHQPKKLLRLRYFSKPVGKHVFDTWLGVPPVFTVRALYSQVAHLTHSSKDDIIIGVPSDDGTCVVELLENTTASVPELEIQTVGFYQQLVRKKPTDLLSDQLEAVYVYDLEQRGDVIVQTRFLMNETSLDSLDYDEVNPEEHVFSGGIPILSQASSESLTSDSFHEIASKLCLNMDGAAFPRVHRVSDPTESVEELHCKYARLVLNHKTELISQARNARGCDSFRSCESEKDVDHDIQVQLHCNLDGCAPGSCSGCLTNAALADLCVHKDRPLGHKRPPMVTSHVLTTGRFTLPDFEAVQPSLDTTLTLADLAAMSCEEDLLVGEDAWRCDHCHNKVATKKTHEVWSVGELVLVQFKRFSHGSLGEKNGRHIDIPLRDFMLPTEDGALTPYNLKGVICHMGTLDRGHYTALCEEDGGGFVGDALHRRLEAL